MELPIPICVMLRLPDICAASLAVFREHRVLYILMKAIWPAEVGYLLLVRLEYKIAVIRTVQAIDSDGLSKVSLPYCTPRTIRDILKLDLRGLCTRLLMPASRRRQRTS